MLLQLQDKLKYLFLKDIICLNVKRREFIGFLMK